MGSGKFHSTEEGRDGSFFDFGADPIFTQGYGLHYTPEESQGLLRMHLRFPMNRIECPRTASKFQGLAHIGANAI